MDNYIGKICPFCKTEIKEGEAVKVCSACGIPHHESCWTENGGCTTFGCTEQNYQPQGTNPTSVCSNCGSPLGEGQSFCANCGTRNTPPAPAVPQVCNHCGAPLAEGQSFCANCGAANTPPAPAVPQVCNHCGAPLAEGQGFCSSCGQKVEVAPVQNYNATSYTYNNGYNNGMPQQPAKSNKKPIIIIAAIAAVLVAIAAVCLVLPKLLITPEKLMAEGDYVKAYEKADASEKDDIIAANAVAICSEICVDSLKDSESFDLRDAWYNEETFAVAMKVSANNSYGNAVINYWYFTWDDEENEYQYYTSVADLEKEEYYSWDSTDDKVEKLLNNVVRELISDMMAGDAYELSSEQVNNINTLFESGLLYNVDLIYIDRSSDDE